MIWNWQQKEWPEFSYDPAPLKELEDRFLHESGLLLGAYAHFDKGDKTELAIDLISNEALKSSEIEGEMLNRDSLQSSLRRNFGLPTDHRRIPPAEQGMAEMMMSLYHHFDRPLSRETLFDWHASLMSGRSDLNDVGRYRTSEEPMQVVSGSVYSPMVHFEAPLSEAVPDEMDRFIRWFNDSAQSGSSPLPALTRAGIAHFYFVSIHPFEDGNGRIARALSEKVLAQGLKQPSLIALSQVIEKHKKDYYAQLNRHNHSLHITSWLRYFAETILIANEYSQRLSNFLLAKTRLYDRMRGKLNARQEKVIKRMFQEGVDGFKGGLSAENYIRITGTSRATATRDLRHLLDIGALTRTGTLKSTRYWLNLSV
ncbi:MAG: Fic family protein [Mariprofundaceae bacterium]|nr:Fic family protein [Mariprofundaceae bacterium]